MTALPIQAERRALAPPVLGQFCSVEIQARITGQSQSLSGSMPQRIRAALEGNQLVALLERECREPRSLAELVQVLKNSSEAAKALADQELRKLIEAYLLVGSVGTEKDPPSLRPKLHTFFQGVYDVGLCMNPACRNESDRGK
jgi:hypothetical protein